MKKLIYLIFRRFYWNYLHYQEIELRKNFSLGNTIRFDNLSLDGNVTIGDYTYLNDGCRIDSGENSKVEIGKYCAIGRRVHITGKTHSLEFPTLSEENPVIKHDEADTVVGDHVWIGDNVYIGPGVTIGNYAIIGALSMVNKDVQDFEVVGGVPARHIKFNTKHRKYPR